jgi:hypothetical protein
MRQAAPIICVALLAIGAAPAHAQVTAIAGGSPDHITLDVPVTASIGGACGFKSGEAPNGSRDVGEITGGFSTDFPFTLECTGPLRMAVVSANGGLLASTGVLPGGYTGLASYDVALHIVGASAASVDGDCAVATLTASAAAPCAFRGPATTAQGLRLPVASYQVPGSYLRVSSPAYAGAAILAASSTYADTLTVTLSAAL